MVYPKKNEMIQYSTRKFSYWISYHQVRYSDEFVRRKEKIRKEDLLEVFYFTTLTS